MWRQAWLPCDRDISKYIMRTTRRVRVVQLVGPGRADVGNITVGWIDVALRAYSYEVSRVRSM